MPPMMHSPIIPNAFEQVERLAQSILCGILAQHHVVTGAGRHEYDGRHVVEALDPFAALVSLAAHVEHTIMNMEMLISNAWNFGISNGGWRNVLKVNFVHLKPRLKNTRRQHTTAQDVLFGWRVVDLFDDADTVEKAAEWFGKAWTGDF